LLTASTAREPVCEPPCAAGVVNFLALAVTVHGGGADLALSIETLRMYNTLQALTSLAGTRPKIVSALYTYCMPLSFPKIRTY
jgi:hypothetical protein